MVKTPSTKSASPPASASQEQKFPKPGSNLVMPFLTPMKSPCAENNKVYMILILFDLEDTLFGWAFEEFYEAKEYTWRKPSGWPAQLG